MSNLTLKKLFLNMINSFKELIKETSKKQNNWFANYEKIINYYKKKLNKNNNNSIDFNKAKEKLKINITFEQLNSFKFNDNKIIEFTNNFNLFIQKLLKIKLKQIEINNILFKNKWDIFKELDDLLIGFHSMQFLKVIPDKKYIVSMFFKEFYSINDKIFNELGVEEFSIINPKVKRETYYDDVYLDAFFADICKIKSKKSMLFHFGKYDLDNNIIHYSQEKNEIYNFFKDSIIWDYINKIRNDLEHNYTTRYYFDNNKNANDYLLHSIYFLIGLNFYCIYECDKKLEQYKNKY